MLILWIGILAAIGGFCGNHIPSAIISAGAFVAFAILESRKLKILNAKDKQDA
jgi:hypothetical protein